MNSIDDFKGWVNLRLNFRLKGYFRAIATLRNLRLLNQSSQCLCFGWHLVGEVTSGSSTSKGKLVYAHNWTALHSTWMCSCH